MLCIHGPVERARGRFPSARLTNRIAPQFLVCKARSGPSLPVRLLPRYFLPDRAKPSTVPHSPPMIWVSWEMLSLTKMASHSSPPR